jgi:malonate transporter and related proteins
MHAVLNAALPMFALILTGFLWWRLGVFSAAATDSLNRVSIAAVSSLVAYLG